jgi:hypothetical protein
MPVHVDELTTEVSVDTGATSTPSNAQAQSPWQEADAYRALRARLARIAERTRAEAYDD